MAREGEEGPGRLDRCSQSWEALGEELESPLYPWEEGGNRWEEGLGLDPGTGHLLGCRGSGLTSISVG